MIILKEEAVKAADISKYKNMNVGYHAGDLGKSEFLGNQMGSNRGTGHFGTGTYFVGDIKNINLGSYSDRPLHVVDFTPYKLYKPSTYDAKKLHDALKFINSQYERFMGRGEWNSQDLAALGSSYSTCKQKVDLLRKYSWLVDPNNPEALEWDFKNDTNLTLDEFNEDTENWDTDKYFKDFVDDLKRFYKDKMEMGHKVWELTYTFHTSEEDLKTLLDSIFTNIKENPDRHSDSASTRLMKHFGYEGVDVRHIPSMDDTEFGSVIYDIKPETILE